MTIRMCAARVAAVALVAASAGCAVPVPGSGRTSGGGAAPTPDGGNAPVATMAARVNDYRRAVGCPPLAWLDGAARAAQAHSDDMARRGYFSHVSPEGLGPGERFAAQGVAWRRVAENIARNPGSPREVLDGWTHSPGHDQNLRQCAYTHHGIGLRDGRWTHVLVTPQ